MNQYLCKTCGQPLSREGNNYHCAYCGNIWMADLADDINAVERANAWEALRVGYFEKAIELFDEILLKNKNDYEAYWGKALSLNAILYVVDTNENKRVPTCNNITESSFLNSNEVQKAISLAPSVFAESYKRQAEYIEQVRLEWLKKASQEPEYDVFISFKDSDRENGIERTQDSIDAQDLYNILTAEGLNVFFSRVSLRNKVSEQYEPYIYNAIRTAKVMIVFGEKPEYFTAPWIKNEWRRYLSRIESGEKHKNSLVVVYKDINVGQLPRVLSSKQCMNYEDVTFSLTLVRHIKAIIEACSKQNRIGRVEIKGGQISKKATSIAVNQIQTRELGENVVKTNINDAQKLSLVDAYLSENMYSDANKLLNEVLVENPDNGEAIFKSLQIKYKQNSAKNISQVDLAMLEKAITNCSKESSTKILDSLYELDLADDYAEALLKTILPFSYANRQNKINNSFEKAIKQKNYKCFCLLLKTLNSNEVDNYVNYNLRFADSCTQDNAIIQCFNNVISVDSSNVKALRELFRLTILTNKDQAKALEIFEQLLKYTDNPEKEIGNAINLLNLNFKPEYCGFIKKILSYSTCDISEYKKTILKTVKRAITDGKFDLANQLILVITTENEQDLDIFWNICLIKTKSICDEDIVNSTVALNSLPEFQKYLLLASDGQRKKCLDIVKRQTQAIEKRNAEIAQLFQESQVFQTIKNLQEIDKMGGVASANSLKILEDKFKRVTNIRDNWHSISNQLYSYRMQIADYTKEIEERNAKKSSLGIFAIKEKKELSREIAVLENTITDNKIKINKLLAQQSEFKSKSYEDICATFESIKKQLEALKEQKSSAELREILNKTEFGKKVLKDYDAFKNISVGSCINFGNYYFTPTIKSPITWVVLEKRGSQALLLAKDGIDCKPYHDSNAVITWQQSSIRKWLNSEFISQAFDSDALSRIFSANVLADKNPSYSTNVGEATVDKVFLLSTQEARKYFSSNNARVCNATPYATANGAMSGPAFWYLRTAGNYGANVSYVDRDGAISDAGYYVNANNRVVRPAIWIETDSVKHCLALINKHQEENKKRKQLEKQKVEQENKIKIERKNKLLASMVALKIANVGDVVNFGSYAPFSSQSGASVQWKVLERKDDKLLLFSNNIIDMKPYNENLEDVTWETCSLRKWLNTEFIERAFISEESDLIVDANISADKTPTYATDAGNPTVDKLFLLSVPEVRKYFEYERLRVAYPTQFFTQTAAKYWWLRTPGSNSMQASRVRSVGDIYGADGDVNKLAGVRPALWIDLNKINIEKI